MTDYQSRTSTLSARVPHDVAKKVDDLAKRMDCSRSEVLARIIRNGAEDLELVLNKCENPLFNFALRVAYNLAGDETEKEEVLKELNLIAERRRIRNQKTLPGIA